MKPQREVSIPGKALVVGLGVSGRALCELLLLRGARVTATDMRPRRDFGDSLDELEARGCVFKLGAHDVADFTGADLVIVSPGVPLDIEPLQGSRAAGCGNRRGTGLGIPVRGYAHRRRDRHERQDGPLRRYWGRCAVRQAERPSSAEISGPR